MQKLGKKTLSKGITLVELIVAISIFALIVPLATNLLVSIVQNQRKILTQQDLLDQTNYVAEYMSRALRTAVKGSGTSCAGTVAYAYYDETEKEKSVEFINHNNLSGDICQVFHLDNGVLEEIKTNLNGVPISTNNLLSSAYKINSFKVFISPEPGTFPAAKYQPRVTFYLDVQANTQEANPPEVKVQTTVSQRNLDI